MTGGSDSNGSQQRRPVNWPTAAFGIAALAFVGFVCWLAAQLALGLVDG